MTLHHGPVKLAARIQHTVPKGTYVEVFENRHRAQARATILRFLDTNHDGILSDEEKSRARIVLYGHSWGAQATVLLARELRRDHIPVLLTVQVDSVAKPWHNDSIIPDNVAEAANFYQPHGLLHGRAKITAADESKTEILGNYRTDYRKTPVPCPEASWAGRFFTPGHTQSECDPSVWSQIEDLVRQRVTFRTSQRRPAPHSQGHASTRESKVAARGLRLPGAGCYQSGASCPQRRRRLPTLPWRHR